MRIDFKLLILCLLVVDANRAKTLDESRDCQQGIKEMWEFMKNRVEPRLQVAFYHEADQADTEASVFEGFNRKMSELTMTRCFGVANEVESEIDKIRGFAKYLRLQIADAFRLKARAKSLFVELVLPANAKAVKSFDRIARLESGFTSFVDEVSRLELEYIQKYPGYVSESFRGTIVGWASGTQGNLVREALRVYKEGRSAPGLGEAIHHGRRMLRPLLIGLRRALKDQLYDASELVSKLVDTYKGSLQQYPRPKGKELTKRLKQLLEAELNRNM